MKISEGKKIAPGLKIIAEFESFVVVYKPSGLLSVPGRTPENQDCVTERFKVLYPDAIPHPSIHRLDWETSGIIVVARTKEAHRQISIQFQKRKVEKHYVAVVDGIVEEAEGQIELPFRLDVDNRPHQMYDEEHGKIGISDWKNLGIEGNTTRIYFNPLTGRTHQLRLHSMHAKGLGFPIVGDCLYGTGTDVDQLKLHACYISFFNPETGERIEFHSDAPF
jgi:tRNA pseudouridine32 synthase / 23S rRNA pseudouridine746 synthase